MLVIVDRKLSNAVEVCAPLVCWLRQNEKFARLMPPAVPVVGVVETSNCNPPIVLLLLPVPSEYMSLFFCAFIDMRRFSIFAGRRANFCPSPAFMSLSNSEMTHVPAYSFQSYSNWSNTSMRVVEIGSVSLYDDTVVFRAYSIGPVSTRPPDFPRKPSP